MGDEIDTSQSFNLVRKPSMSSNTLVLNDRSVTSTKEPPKIFQVDMGFGK